MAFGKIKIQISRRSIFNTYSDRFPGNRSLFFINKNQIWVMMFGGFNDKRVN